MVLLWGLAVQPRAFALCILEQLQVLTPAALLPPHPAVSHRWGNHLSNKFFLEKKFVVKHITNKHAEKVEEARKEVRGAALGGTRAVVAGTVLLAMAPSCMGCAVGALSSKLVPQQQQVCAA